MKKLEAPRRARETLETERAQGESSPSRGGRQGAEATLKPAAQTTVALRQEIDGLQAEQLEFVPCGPILQDEDRRGAEPCPDKR